MSENSVKHELKQKAYRIANSIAKDYAQKIAYIDYQEHGVVVQFKEGQWNKDKEDFDFIFSFGYQLPYGQLENMPESDLEAMFKRRLEPIFMNSHRPGGGMRTKGMISHE